VAADSAVAAREVASWLPIVQDCGKLAASAGDFDNYRKRIEKERAEASKRIPLAVVEAFNSDRRWFRAGVSAHREAAYEIIARASSLFTSNS